MRDRSDITAYIRKRESGDRWYASWYDAKGRRVVWCTRVRVMEDVQDRGKSKAIAAAAMKRAEKPQAAPHSLAGYASGFFDWEGDWVRRQLVKKRRGCSRSWCATRQAMLDKHILPADRLGDVPLSDLTLPMIERTLGRLKLSNQTLNHILYTLRIVLTEAAREKLIPENPLQHAEPMGKEGLRRDALTLAELALLFPRKAQSLLAIWKLPKYATCYLTMAATGIREGEARALAWRHILPGGWLLIERAVKQDGSFGTPKSGDMRVAALSTRARAVLRWWHDQTPFGEPNDLLFFGDRADHPLNRRTFGDIFPRALEAAGIEVGTRNLSTHSLRHTYNTIYRRVLPADALQALMGHKDAAMSEWYDHPVPADLIRSLQPVRRLIEAERWKPQS